ncbi:hypothetical protein EYF80_067086 [Liparis tanakae]|uniref:Uncharacterized protein n=1 Tax=Liparis tanakae TaxID=230148 RepID=A0A4Z2E244_9TELE|nr:hypothetical protein EYF80_067086 [Liparis tanakae]
MLPCRNAQRRYDSINRSLLKAALMVISVRAGLGTGGSGDRLGSGGTSGHCSGLDGSGLAEQQRDG